MKKQLCFISAIFAPLCIVVCAGCTPSVETPKAGRQMNPEVSHGQVRVVLLRAGPVAAATNQPTFVVTCGIEIPKEGAFSDLSFNSSDEIALVVRGKPIDYQGEFSSGTMGFSDLPRQSELRKPTLQEGKVMIFEDVTFTGLHIDANEIGVRFRFSWRGTPLSFDFEHVPVGYRSAEQGA